MTKTRIADANSTVVWDGNVIVLGAGLEGLVSALSCTQAGYSVCLLEEGPTLGREVSRGWRQYVPHSELGERLETLCADRGVHKDGPLDIFASTLAFDRIAEEEGIQSIVRVQPTRLLTDNDDKLVGVEIVGKSGRQVVRSDVLIDATPGRHFTCRAVGRDVPLVTKAERRMYVHGVESEGLQGQVGLPEKFGVRGNSASVNIAAWSEEVVIGLPVDCDPPTSTEDLQARTHSLAGKVMGYLRANVEAFANATLVDVAPDVLVEERTGALRQEDVKDTGLLFVREEGNFEQRLIAAEDISDEIEPAQKQESADLKCSETRDARRVEISELEAAPEWGLEEVVLPEVSATMHDPTDVIVAGWGAGGALAALTAAEEGASVSVVDPCPVPGGIATAGLIHSYYYGKEGGRQDQIDEITTGEGMKIAENVQGFHPVAKASVLRESLTRAGVSAYTGHVAFGVVKEGNDVQGVVTAAADGYHVFPCEVAIDATGDGDLADAAGAEYRLGRVGDGFPQPYSYTPSVVNDGAVGHHNFDAGWVDPTDTLDYSRAHFEGRRKLWELGPFSEDKHYCTLASMLGIRESRFVKGPITLTFEDFLEGRTYPDTVCDAIAHYDNHAQEYAEESDWARRYVVMCGQWRYECEGEVPYRALYPRGVEGMLIGCRALSVDHDLHQLLRMQRDMQRIGEVCGLAAAQSVATITPTTEIDMAKLRDELDKRGILPESPAKGFESASMLDLFDLLGTEKTGEAMVRLSKKASDNPAWDEYFRRETNQDNRFCAAIAGALAGRSDEDVRAELERVVKARDTEPQWGYRTPPAYIIAILALTEIDADGVLDYIASILQEGDLPPTNVLLLLQAIADMGDSDGIQVIRDYLAQTEDDGFGYSLKACPDKEKTSYRFAVEIRAVKSLNTLGCQEEDGRLEKYIRSPHLLIRRYAMDVAGAHD